MRWENPSFLFLLWILPGLAALMVYAHRRRIAAARQFADPRMVRRLMPALNGVRPWVKSGLLLLAVGMLIVAAARPRFGEYFEDVSARGVDLFVLLDVSRSMLAEDVAPNRLERAKSDILDLLKKLSGDRIGLIAFAGAPAILVPLTTDQGFFRTALDETGADSAPRGGTLIGDAIRKALESMQPRYDRDQVIVLITDGEDQESYPVEAAEAAQQRGVKIITVGLGDPAEGARIPVRDESGNLQYVKDDQGQEHWTIMDDRTLKEIALKTRGAYIPAATKAYDLGQIYEDELAGLSQGELQVDKRKRYADQFPLFICLGLGYLLAEMLVPLYPPSSSPGRRPSLIEPFVLRAGGPPA